MNKVLDPDGDFLHNQKSYPEIKSAMVCSMDLVLQSDSAPPGVQEMHQNPQLSWWIRSRAEHVEGGNRVVTKNRDTFVIPDMLCTFAEGTRPDTIPDSENMIRYLRGSARGQNPVNDI